jgi:hypothetical protein
MISTGSVQRGGIGHHPGALPGRDNAALTEPTPGHTNCLTARKACARREAAVPPARPDCPIGRAEGGAHCVGRRINCR